MADPLEVPETEVVVSALESMQSQITAARTLVAFLRGRRAEAHYALVEEQLHLAEAHLREADKIMRAPATQHTTEISPTIPWIAASPSEERQGRQKPGASITLRERGDILSRAVQARKLNHPATIVLRTDRSRVIQFTGLHCPAQNIPTFTQRD